MGDQQKEQTQEEVIVIENQVITSIAYPGADGIGVDGNTVALAKISNCTVDLCAVDQDELLGITHCAEADVNGCTFKNGIKAILCGSGDAEDETGKDYALVIFKDCIIENFGRRAPEVQNRYNVIMENCTIRLWGTKDQFDVRAFGAWAHNGGGLLMYNCKFEQDSILQCGWKNFFVDLANSIGQAWNDRKLFGLLDWRTYLPGTCKGAYATDSGFIRLRNCTKNKWWIYLQNNRSGEETLL